MRTKMKRGMNMEKAVGYIRVFTTEHATEGISLSNQRAKIKAYCGLNEIDLVEIIEDAGKSGKNLNRHGMQNLLSIAEASLM
jgi:site-specific DNA recombinase